MLNVKQHLLLVINHWLFTWNLLLLSDVHLLHANLFIAYFVEDGGCHAVGRACSYYEWHLGAWFCCVFVIMRDVTKEDLTQSWILFIIILIMPRN